jgi:hypothetical protein
MGKTPANKRLVIDVHADIADWPEFAELVEKGHTVRRVETDADLVLGPRCWRMVPELQKYLEHAIKAARKARGA